MVVERTEVESTVFVYPFVVPKDLVRTMQAAIRDWHSGKARLTRIRTRTKLESRVQQSGDEKPANAMEVVVKLRKELVWMSRYE